MQSRLSCISIPGTSEGLFDETSTVAGLENEKEKVRSNMFRQHEKVRYAELTLLR
jgi:hypothetical protein